MRCARRRRRPRARGTSGRTRPSSRPAGRSRGDACRTGRASPAPRRSPAAARPARTSRRSPAARARGRTGARCRGSRAPRRRAARRWRGSRAGRAAGGAEVCVASEDERQSSSADERRVHVVLGVVEVERSAERASADGRSDPGLQQPLLGAGEISRNDRRVALLRGRGPRGSGWPARGRGRGSASTPISRRTASDGSVATHENQAGERSSRRAFAAKCRWGS